MPAEFWVALASPDSPAARWVLSLYQACWDQKTIPEKWHDSRVAMLFKKGDPADCSNYRPISLLCIGNKLFAMILLQRLRDAGAEEALWPTQFGFRRGRGTLDALFVARRVIEESMELKDGKAVLLALDWARRLIPYRPTLCQWLCCGSEFQSHSLR